uniref:Uncharacterized protein n=1 Tax=Romanomermis culicivorax TaxID=13658 RepID=A0A915I9D6_ROMCU
MTTAGFFIGDYIKQFLTTTVAPRTEQAHPYRDYCRLKDTNRRYNIFCRHKDNPTDDSVDFCNFYQVACLIYGGSGGGGGGGSSSIFESGDSDDDFDFSGINESGNNERGNKKYPIGMSDIFKKDQKPPVPVQFGFALKVD